VAGGLGERLGIDPVVIRLAFVVLALAGGAGVVLYLALFLVMGWPDPKAEPVPTPRTAVFGRRSRPRSSWPACC